MLHIMTLCGSLMHALILVMPLTKGLPYMLKLCLSNGTGHQRRYIAFQLGIWKTSATKKQKQKMIKRVQILEPLHCIQMVPLKYKEPKSVTKKRTPM
jgi:hypothetical protein